MPRAIHIAIAGAAFTGCSVPPFDPCPCPADTSCQLELNRCIRLSETPTEVNGCVLWLDRKLHCRNNGGVPGSAMHSGPNTSTAVVDHLRTSYSFFNCWGTGQAHSRGNVWYYTEGDERKVLGWVSGDNVFPPEAFEADPAAFGFLRCTSP